MGRIKIIIAFLPALLLMAGMNVWAQDKNWTLRSCIEYAVEQNIDVRKAKLGIQESEVNFRQSKSNRLPSVSASIGTNISLEKEYDAANNEYGSFKSGMNMSYGVNSSLSLFDGYKMKKQIEQAELNLQINEYSSESVRESVELNILAAYLNILYASEEVKNAQKQIDATQEELHLAEERMNIGVISKNDYLIIKSELATEKLTLANAKSSLTMAKVNLMQLMEFPVKSDFDIVYPDIEKNVMPEKELTAAGVYNEALIVKPQVKQAALSVKSSLLEQEIAKSDMYPTLTLNAGINSGWMSGDDTFNYIEQLNNTLVPTIGLTLSIPIFQKNQVTTNIELAQISAEYSKLEEIETKNSLRKEVEQAVSDAETALMQFEAGNEQYEAMMESYTLASEKYKIGMINSVDFLTVKKDLIVSESNLLQAKFNLVFNNKIIDFYRGKSIYLTK